MRARIRMWVEGDLDKGEITVFIGDGAYRVFLRFDESTSFRRGARPGRPWQVWTSVQKPTAWSARFRTRDHAMGRVAQHVGRKVLEMARDGEEV